MLKNAIKAIVIIIILVFLSACPQEPLPNNSPSIMNITTTNQLVNFGETITLTCFAFDPDGDSLTYSWNASSGTLGSTNSSSVQWTAPDVETVTTIGVTVSEENGNSVSDFLYITVIDGNESVSNFLIQPGNEELILTWQNPSSSNFDSVEIRRRTGSYPTGPTDGDPVYTGNNESHSDSPLINGVTYYYTAYAKNYSGEWSDGVTASGIPTLDAGIRVTGVNLNKSSATLLIGNSETLIYSTLPINADNQDVTWNSSNIGVATVNSSGLVTAVSSGQAVITVTTADGGFTDTCAVTVSDITKPVTGISINPSSYTFGTIGNILQLIATITPSDATNQSITWSSSNANIAAVSLSGLVTAVSSGQAVITATTADGGFTDTCTVTVPVPEFTVSSTSLSFGDVEVGSYKDLSFTITNTGTGTLAGSVSESYLHYSIISGSGTYNLGANDSWPVTVRFSPTSSGFKSCTISTSYTNVSATGNGVSTPPPPTGVSASDGTYTDRIRISWNSVSGADGYKVYRTTSSTPIGTTTSTRTYYDYPATPGTTYSFRVKAYNDVGYSVYSSSDSGWRKVSTPSLVSPSNGSTTNDSTPYFDWSSVTGAAGYEIQIGSSTFTTSSSYYTPSSRADGTYSWKVRAKDSSNRWGNWSSSRSITIDAIRRLLVTAEYIYINDDADLTGAGEITWYFSASQVIANSDIPYWNMNTQVSISSGTSYNFTDNTFRISVENKPGNSYYINLWITEWDVFNSYTTNVSSNLFTYEGGWGIGNNKSIYASGNSDAPKGTMYYRIVKLD